MGGVVVFPENCVCLSGGCRAKRHNQAKGRDKEGFITSNK